MIPTFPPLPNRRYDIISADPPWSFKTFSEKGWEKAPQAHYKCESVEDICALDVRSIARPDCWLFLWTSAPLLDRAFDVLRAWGFTYCSRISWAKVTKSGARRMGPGFVVRTYHEDILIGKRGGPAYAGALDSLFDSMDGDMFDGVARRHSEKPEEFYARVERFKPVAFRLDLFSRTNRPGWDSWGDEAGKFGDAA
jgi:N6-adenosine-specific RNA methylase IME4